MILILLIKVFSVDNDRETLSELYKPLQDSLIKQCIEIIDLDKKHDSQSSALLKAKGVWSKVFPKPRRSWLPTGCLVRKCLVICFILFCFNKWHRGIMLCLNIQKLLEVLHGALPKMSLIASDFSYLPDVRILGERAPLVSTKVWLFFYFLVNDNYTFFGDSHNIL